jgi:hypothetical protein
VNYLCPTLGMTTQYKKPRVHSPYDLGCREESAVLARAEIPYAWHARLFAESERRGVDVSQVIRDALKMYLDGKDH